MHTTLIRAYNILFFRVDRRSAVVSHFQITTTIVTNKTHKEMLIMKTAAVEV